LEKEINIKEMKDMKEEKEKRIGVGNIRL